MHDFITQQDHTGYEWAECAQCGAVDTATLEREDDHDSRRDDYREEDLG